MDSSLVTMFLQGLKNKAAQEKQVRCSNSAQQFLSHSANFYDQMQLTVHQQQNSPRNNGHKEWA